jgi:hypothetical protein
VNGARRGRYQKVITPMDDPEAGPANAPLIQRRDTEMDDEHEDEQDDFTIWQSKLRTWFLPCIISIAVVIVSTLGVILLLRTRGKCTFALQGFLSLPVCSWGCFGSLQGSNLTVYRAPPHQDETLVIVIMACPLFQC